MKKNKKPTVKENVKPALRLYLEDIARTPLLDREAESSLANQIAEDAKLVRSLVLSNDYVIRQIAKLLARVSGGDLKPLQVFGIRKTDLGAQGEMTNRIKSVISILSERLAENCSDFRIVSSRADVDDKRAAWSRIKTRRAEMVRDIESFQIRFRYLWSAFRRIEAIHKRMLELQLRIAEMPPASTRAELRRLTRCVGGPVPALSRLTTRVEKAFGKWNQSKNAMVQANLRLVVRIAKRYRECGIARLDVIQAGNTGLMKAVDKFDPDRDFKFSTYAKWWIHKSIFHAIDSLGGPISLTSYAGDKSRRVKLVRAELRQLFGRAPTAEEIAESMARNTLAKQLGRKPSSDEFQEWLYGPESDGYKVLKKFEQEIAEIDHVTSPAFSTDEQSGGDEGGTISDLIAAPVWDELDEPERALLLQGIKSLSWCLTDDEQQIISLRYGLDGIARTKKVVARMLGIEPDDVKQNEKRAIGKLRKAARSKSNANTANRRHKTTTQLNDVQKTIIAKEIQRRVDRGATPGRASQELRYRLLNGKCPDLDGVVVDLTADALERYVARYASGA